MCLLKPHWSIENQVLLFFDERDIQQILFCKGWRQFGLAKVIAIKGFINGKAGSFDQSVDVVDLPIFDFLLRKIRIAGMRRDVYQLHVSLFPVLPGLADEDADKKRQNADKNVNVNSAFEFH